jgi:uncharacterized protein YaiI (UPF0178 family)
MKLYIDGDAFPNLLKPIVTKQINRLKLETIVISNKPISIASSPYITYDIVKEGADEADHKIVEMVEANDLVITADIPLADRVITKHAYAIDHRGALYEKENIKQYLAMRNLMAELRDSGEILGGPKPFSKKDAQSFANQLNAFLAKNIE